MNGKQNKNQEVIGSVRRLSQHFLKDQKVIDDLVLASDAERDNTILEIGPGTGEITKKLLEIADKVIAFWDKISKGTLSSINIAKKEKKPLEIVYF